MGKDNYGRIEQLYQIVKAPVWDGNLISKTAAATLEKKGYVSRTLGWSHPTVKGMRVAIDLGMLKS